MKISVIGLGTMGNPIALNLIKAGHSLTVYNRSKEKSIPFKDNASVAETALEAIIESDVSVLTVPGEREISNVLEYKDGSVSNAVKGKTIVNMATISPEYSEEIGVVIDRAGGKYIEAPVSGSRKPAELGQLVILAAGDETEIDRLDPLFSAIGKETVKAGLPPNAMRIKLANNLLLISMLEALAESYNFAEKLGLDTKQFLDFVLSGQMSNSIFQVKASKLLSGDFSQQAPIKHVAKDIKLICGEAERMGIEAPSAAVNKKLYEKAVEQGLGDDDILGVLKVLRSR